MKQKIFVVPLQLDTKSDDILNTIENEISENTKEKLETTINIAKAIQAEKTRAEALKKTKDNRYTEILEIVYKKIIDAGEHGLPYSDYKLLLDEHRLNYSVMSMKLKNRVKQKDERGELEKVKRKGVIFYRFVFL